MEATYYQVQGSVLDFAAADQSGGEQSCFIIGGDATQLWTW